MSGMRVVVFLLALHTAVSLATSSSVDEDLKARIESRTTELRDASWTRRAKGVFDVVGEDIAAYIGASGNLFALLLPNIDDRAAALQAVSKIGELSQDAAVYMGSTIAQARAKYNRECTKGVLDCAERAASALLDRVAPAASPSPESNTSEDEQEAPRVGRKLLWISETPTPHVSGKKYSSDDHDPSIIYHSAMATPHRTVNDKDGPETPTWTPTQSSESPSASTSLTPTPLNAIAASNFRHAAKVCRTAAENVAKKATSPQFLRLLLTVFVTTIVCLVIIVLVKLLTDYLSKEGSLTPMQRHSPVVIEQASEGETVEYEDEYVEETDEDEDEEGDEEEEDGEESGEDEEEEYAPNVPVQTETRTRPRSSRVTRRTRQE